ncbi:DNA cytosine methyltransferase [Desulfovibrio sp. JC022]|uniref:DNA cytosine methyltransferase n=1 Tax=Desulfovibrio sp. JC022 TaxID=2593642 RepID=UPI0013D7B488|nr:DNA (cytosine-5-)-methyltransferase [Desulfovibrio sp. JC022]NDV24329.1 DNA cytosine methyltransferase [Desulfovibrio sp. JC022]
MTKFLLGELFCGPGGMALGARLAAEEYQYDGSPLPIEHIWGVDKDEHAISTYNSNNLGEGVHCDALDFANNIKDADHKILANFPPINALAFGFPCNDFSVVGERKGINGKYGNLYKAGVKVIEQMNPLFFIAENVSGIHSANSDATFYQIISELEAAGKHGYDLTIHLYKFDEYGVAQMRHRYIIVGIRKDLKIKFRIPEPTHKTPVTASEILGKPYQTPPSNANNFKQDPRVQERLLFTPPWHNAWFLDTLLEMGEAGCREYLEKKLPWFEEKLGNATDHEIKERIIACKLNCKKARMSHIYRRLHPDKPAYTITGSGGGGTHGYHWEECRCLTNRERARLQSFPDDFIFMGSLPQVRKQIGMAVPPAGAKIIFKAILDSFAGKKYPYVEEPSYKPMDAESFKAYRSKRYKIRLKERLRNNYSFELSDYHKLEDIIETLIEEDLSLDEAESFILETR